MVIETTCDAGHTVEALLYSGEMSLTPDRDDSWAPVRREADDGGECYAYSHGGCCWRAAVDAALEATS